MPLEAPLRPHDRFDNLHKRTRVALIVEDDPGLQDVMKRVLAALRFEVLSARHYAAAARHLSVARPDVVYIDVGLPAQSGYELCEYIRKTLGWRRVPIVVASEYGSAGDMAHAENAGGNAFLHKPFSMRELSCCISSLLERTPSSAGPVHELAILDGLILGGASFAMAPVDVTRPETDAAGAAPSRHQTSALFSGDPGGGTQSGAPGSS